MLVYYYIMVGSSACILLYNDVFQSFSVFQSFKVLLHRPKKERVSDGT